MLVDNKCLMRVELGSTMPDATRPRVLLADDHAEVLRALARLLRSACEIVGTVMDGDELFDAAERLAPDVVVIDLNMPGLSGLENCRRIKNALPQAQVIIVTAANDEEIGQEALRCGASAFVFKPRMVEDLLDAIEKAMQGRTLSSRG
jgi:DNA-binding NarL/FixJ family response regulator